MEPSEQQKERAQVSRASERVNERQTDRQRQRKRQRAKHRETGRQTDRQTDGDGDRGRDRRRDRERERETLGQTNPNTETVTSYLLACGHHVGTTAVTHSRRVCRSGGQRLCFVSQTVCSSVSRSACVCHYVSTGVFAGQWGQYVCLASQPVRLSVSWSVCLSPACLPLCNCQSVAGQYFCL